MRKYKGVVRESRLEGGFWQLVCDDGQSYTLGNADEGLKRHGLRVVVQGDVDEDAMGIAMSGPVLIVRSYRVA